MAEQKNGNNVPEIPFDIDSDIKRLKMSSRILAIVLVFLAVAFLVLLALSLTGYFEIQQGPGSLNVVNKYYANEDSVPVYKDPTEFADIVGKVDKNDSIFEIGRSPGFVQIQAGEVSGWVNLQKVKTSLAKAAATKGIDITGPLELVFNLESSSKDIMVHGKITNRLDGSVRNIRLLTSFFSDDWVKVYSEFTNLVPKEDLSKNGTTSFTIIGKGILDKARHVTCEIEDFDYAATTIVIKGSESNPAPEGNPTPEGETPK